MDLKYLFRTIIQEILNDHTYDAMRYLYWYTGWCVTIADEVKKINRDSGVYACWKDEPYIEMTEEEFKELIGHRDE